MRSALENAQNNVQGLAGEASRLPGTSGSFVIAMALLSDPVALSALMEVLVNRLDDLDGDPT